MKADKTDREARMERGGGNAIDGYLPFIDFLWKSNHFATLIYN